MPAYAHGETDVGGAGSTSSGLSMLMSASARGIRQVINNIEEMDREVLQRLYNHNMMYSEDDMIKGDARVVVKGISAATAKELLQVRRNEMLNNSNNPVDLQIFGIEGRKELWRENLKGLEMDVDKIISKKPTQPPMPVQGNAPMANQIALDNTGSPMGGGRMNMMQDKRKPAMGMAQ